MKGIKKYFLEMAVFWCSVPAIYFCDENSQSFVEGIFHSCGNKKEVYQIIFKMWADQNA